MAVLLSLGACSGDLDNGPAEVKWDRYTCERCRMVLSDRQHAAQIRVPGPDGRAQRYYFDDLGCALVWLQDQPFRDAPDTKIWVNDWRTGQWIDARSATYLSGQITPMGYGLGAQSDPHPGGLDFAQARQRILERERGVNRHGAHPPAPDL